jgi:nucleoside 2-deoxyribosyltransferase
MKIYLAHPISRLTPDQVISYYEHTTRECQKLGYKVLCPMTAKGYLRTEEKYRATGYDNPVATNHAIYERDQWMVKNCDVLLCDLIGRAGFSVGCTMEMAWASLLGKHTIAVIPAESEYQHAFILEAADIVFETMDEAMEYLDSLINGKIK